MIFLPLKNNLHNYLNSFTPEFLKWTLLSLNLVISTFEKKDASQKSNAEWQTSVDPDQTPHLDLHCLHKYLFCSIELKGLNIWTL